MRGIVVLRWFKFRMIELAVALPILACSLYLIQNIQDQRKLGVPASAWFSVTDIFVPDHASGEDVTMTYDRTIKEEVRGFWLIEAQRQDNASGSFVSECSASGISEYEPQDYIPNNQVKWSWFMGDKCLELPGGTYRLRGSWVLRRPSWPDKKIATYSNLFKIY